MKNAEADVAYNCKLSKDAQIIYKRRLDLQEINTDSDAARICRLFIYPLQWRNVKTAL